MGIPNPAEQLFRRFGRWMVAYVDAVPPYKGIEGILENKVIENDHRCFIYVGSEKVEVDRYTYEALAIGETLRIRYTRKARAINIDRLKPGQGPV